MKVTYLNQEENIQKLFRIGEGLKFAAYREGDSQAVMLTFDFWRHRQMIAEILLQQRVNPDDKSAVDSVLLGGGTVSKRDAKFGSTDFYSKIGRECPKDPQEAKALLEDIRTSVTEACEEKVDETNVD